MMKVLLTIIICHDSSVFRYWPNYVSSVNERFSNLLNISSVETEMKSVYSGMNDLQKLGDQEGAPSNFQFDGGNGQ